MEEIVLERRRAAPVVSRREVAVCQFLVSHRVPKHPTEHEGLPEREVPPYLSWPVMVGGERIWVYLHADSPTQHIGRTVTAQVIVMERVREDGTVERYIDLHVVEGEATHRLFVGKYTSLDAEWFICGLRHVDALAVVAPAAIKYTAEKGFFVPEPKPEKARSYGDPMLDRACNEEGWDLDLERTTLTEYFLVKGERTRKMSRPKKDLTKADKKGIAARA